MYQIDGPPMLMSVDEFQRKQNRGGSSHRRNPPGSDTVFQRKIVTDRRGTPITVFEGASHALSEINSQKKVKPLKVGISSRTDEPSWALQIMQWLTVADGTTLARCFDKDLIEISYDNKAKHFISLNRKTGIPFEDMAFFDNEYSNIKSVGSLGVKCYFTPNGMTKDAWNKCLADFGIMH